MARIWNKHKQSNTPLKRKVFVATYTNEGLKFQMILGPLKFEPSKRGRVSLYCRLPRFKPRPPERWFCVTRIRHLFALVASFVPWVRVAHPLHPAQAVRPKLRV